MVSNCLETERKLLSFSGFYPRKRSVFQRINSVFHLSVALAQLFSMIVLMSLNFNKLDRIIGDSLFLVTHLGFLCKLFNFLLNPKRMLLIEAILNSPVFKLNSQKAEDIIRESVKSIDNFAKMFRVTCIFVLIFYGVTPFINYVIDGEGARLMLPLPGWIPYDVNNGIMYTFTYVFQMSSIAISAYNNSTIDVLNCKLMTLATAKCRILEMYLKDIDYEKLGAKAADELTKCVIFHSEILRYRTGQFFLRFS